MSWTEEKVAKLKELWGKGNTASQIAEIIGGISRNAVIGKAHRLNLSAKLKTKISSSSHHAIKRSSISDGEIQKRQWKIDKIDDHNYEGIAGDVVGKAKGYSYGPAFKFEYVLLVPVKGKEMKITFDDWIFKQDEKVAINRATMTKFGIKVAELTVFFQKN